MRIIAVVAGLAVLASSGAARAEGWVTTVGARIRLKPPYEGADRYVVSPHPTLAIRRADRPYRYVPLDGGGTVALLDTDWIVAGPMLRLRYRRDDKAAFAGLNPVGLAAEPGAFVDLWPATWLRIRLEGRHGLSGHHGLVGDAGFDLIHNGERWSASIGPRIGFGDARYMQTYFGVTQAEADLSPVIDRAYRPNGGLRYTGATVAGAYRLDRRWRATVDLTYNRLASKALASPVVQTLGSGHQVLLGVGVNYSFGPVR